MNTSQVSRRTRLAALAARIARELDLPFVSATMEETLERRDYPHVLFRSNTDGTITFAVVGVLPSCSLYREQPTSKLVDTVEHWLEGVLIGKGAARVQRARNSTADIEAAEMDAIANADAPPPPMRPFRPRGEAGHQSSGNAFGAALREMYPKKDS